MSQVIPVLLLALLFEARVLGGSGGRRSARWALNFYVVLVLVLGEALVLSTLPLSNDTGEGNEALLSGCHEYIAFDLGVYAVAVALTALVVFVSGGVDEKPEPVPVRVVAEVGQTRVFVPRV